MIRLLLPLLALAAPMPKAPSRWLPYDTFRLQPADEADRRVDFDRYRTALVRALDARDVKALLGFVSERVAMSLHDPSLTGKDAFVRAWKLGGEHPRDSKLWDELREVLRLGGAYTGDEFRAPYMFARWPERYPHLDFLAVTARRAEVLAAPVEGARVLATLTQEVVGRFDGLPNPPGWRAVRTATGVTGYVRDEETRSPLDYRAVFRRENGAWRLALFADGDWEAHERFK